MSEITKEKISQFPNLNTIEDSSKIYIAGIVGDETSGFLNWKIPLDILKSNIATDYNKTIDEKIEDIDISDIDPDYTGYDTSTRQYIYQCTTASSTTAPGKGDDWKNFWKDDLAEVLSYFTTGKYIFTCFRDRNSTTGDYGNWQGPYILSVYGKEGKDGDGVEFIFYLSSKELDTEDFWETHLIKDSKKISISSDDYLTDNFVPKYWTDDPSTTTETMPYQYMAKRVKSNGVWGSFSTPVIWSFFSEDGIDGTNGRSTITEYLFCRSSALPTILTTEGSFDNPGESFTTSDGYTWTDGITEGTDRLWRIYRVFTSDGVGQDEKWNGPELLVDAKDQMDVCYFIGGNTLDTSNMPVPGAESPNDETEYWKNESTIAGNESTVYYMAVSYYLTDTLNWTKWIITKIKGEDSISSGIVISCDNDIVILDDNTVSQTSITNGCDGTLSFYKNGVLQSDAIFTLGTYSLPNGITPSISGNVLNYIVDSDTIGTSLTKGVYYTEIIGTYNGENATYKHVITIKDISAGETYKLIISPNTILQTGTLLSDSNFSIKLQKITDGIVNNIIFDGTNYYYKIIPYKGTIQYSSTNSTLATINIRSLNHGSLYNNAGYEGFIIEAYNNTTLLDSETIAITKNGDKGDAGNDATALIDRGSIWEAKLSDNNFIINGNFSYSSLGEGQYLRWKFEDNSGTFTSFITINNVTLSYSGTSNEFTLTSDIVTAKILASFMSTPLIIELWREKQDNETSDVLLNSLSYTLQIPIGYFLKQDSSGTYSIYNSYDEFSSISQNLDSIDATISKLLRANLLTDVTEFNDENWISTSCSSLTTLCFDSKYIHANNNDYTINNLNTTDTYSITIDNVNIKSGEKYILSWRGAPASVITNIEVNDTIIATSNGSYFTSTTANNRILKYDSDLKRWQVAFTLSEDKILDVNLITFNIKLTEAYVESLNLNEYQTPFIIIGRAKLEYIEDLSKDECTDFTISTEETRSIANLALKANEIALSVKDTAAELKSELELNFSEINAYVKTDEEIGGLTISKDGTTFIGSVTATEFKVIPRDTTVNSQLQVVIWSNTTEEQSWWNTTFGTTTEEGVTSPNKAYPEEGTPLIISSTENGSYILDFTKITFNEETSTTWYSEVGFSSQNYYTLNNYQFLYGTNKFYNVITTNGIVCTAVEKNGLIPTGNKIILTMSDLGSNSEKIEKCLLDTEYTFTGIGYTKNVKLFDSKPTVSNLATITFNNIFSNNNFYINKGNLSLKIPISGITNTQNVDIYENYSCTNGIKSNLNKIYLYYNDRILKFDEDYFNYAYENYNFLKKTPETFALQFENIFIYDSTNFTLKSMNLDLLDKYKVMLKYYNENCID